MRMQPDPVKVEQIRSACFRRRAMPAILGETGRRFLGFNVRVPTTLDEYYLPPDQRLYKPNQG